MKTDYELLKEDYGERFAKFCRDNFPLLQEKSVLYKTISSIIAPTKHIYNDLVENYQEENFVKYVYSKYCKTEKREEVKVFQSPEELMLQAGYRLYKCETVEDVMKFKCYYEPREVLCTFDSPEERLQKYHVFFAVKTNIDEIARNNFKIPERQDEYGTSVISLQFYKGDNSYLSIKNRYNHTVKNPDSTFSNNLDNIINGLSASFNSFYGYNPSSSIEDDWFEMDNYVKASDDKYYHYNYELFNIYYCENNVVIENFEPTFYNKSRYILIDYMLFDRKDKKIVDYSLNSDEFFPEIEQFKDIVKIDVEKCSDEVNCKKVSVMCKGNEEPITLIVDDRGRLIKFYNPNLQIVDNFYFYTNQYMQEIELKNVQKIANHFLKDNAEIKRCYLPNVKEIGSWCLSGANRLETIYLPKCEIIDSNFLVCARSLKSISLPEVKEIGKDFLNFGTHLETIYAPKLEFAGSRFLADNHFLEELNLPSLKILPAGMLKENKNLKRLIVPNCMYIQDYCLFESNINMEEFYAPNVRQIPDKFLSRNIKLTKLYIPKVETIGDCFLYNNTELTKLDLPSVTHIASYLLAYNKKVKYFNAPKLEVINFSFTTGRYLFSADHNQKFEYFYCPNLTKTNPGNFPEITSCKNLEHYLKEEETNENGV